MAILSKTGNSEIDKQHSVIQDCLSDLASHLDGARDPATLLGSLEALYSYTEWHFAFEERLLERNEHPNRVEHIAEHRAIIGQLNKLRRHLDAGNNDAVSLISIISQWIVDHVNNEDAKSAKHLGNSPVSTMQRDRRLPIESTLGDKAAFT